MNSRLLAREVGLPHHEVERLLQLVTGLGRADLMAGATLAEDQRARFEELAHRRLSGEPLQYLEGMVPFGPIEVMVDRRVLIPRPETEHLWELAVQAANDPRIIVDLCTGSGNLALALKHHYPGARVLGTDLSFDALEVARANARRLRLDVELLEGSLFDCLPPSIRGLVDLAVANPPYVAEGEVADLPVEVKDYEPRHALVAGPRGDEVLSEIAEAAADWLAPEGLLLCEIAETQGDRALLLFGSTLEVELRTDLAGKTRYVLARKS